MVGVGGHWGTLGIIYSTTSYNGVEGESGASKIISQEKWQVCISLGPRPKKMEQQGINELEGQARRTQRF